MKNLLLIASLFPLAVNAQRSMQEYYELNMANNNMEINYFEEQSAPLKLRKSLKIKEIKIVNSPRHGKQYESVLSYNHAGKVLHSSGKNYKIDYTYQNDSLLTNTVSVRKNKVYAVNSTYENGQIASRETLKNGKPESRMLFVRNAQNKITSSKLVKDRKTYEIRYAYNDEGKMSKSVYLINGKVKKEWIYECKPEGEIVASKTEAISSVCTYREESADGSYITFTRSLQEGKPYLFKQTFSKDSVLIQSQKFLNDTTLVWENKKQGNVETVSSFKKSGKLNYKQVNVYNEKGSLVSREYFHKNPSKSQTKSVFELNADGTAKSRTFYWKGKLQTSASFEYSFY